VPEGRFERLDAPAHGRLRSYELVAPFYEELARVLSLGRIGASKRVQLDWLEPGSHVLYAGVGSGEDALAAFEAGFETSALDLSPSMLARLRRRLGSRASGVRFYCEDFLAHAGGAYDAVALNFFLNVFSGEELGGVLDHTVGLLACEGGGRIVIADFARPTSAWERVVFALHYRPLSWAAWALGLAALHPIHDYRAAMAERGGRLLHARRFGVYESLVFGLGNGHGDGPGSMNRS